MQVAPVSPPTEESYGPKPDFTAPKSRSALASALALQGRTTVVVVHLDPPVFAACWALLVLARSACIAYCVGAAYALVVLHHPYMAYYAELLRPGIRPLLLPSACLYVVVAVAHVLQLVRLLVHFLKPPPDTRMPSLQSTGQCSWVINRIWRPLFSRRGFFGVESKYYEARYAVRETIEIISQSVQAYTSSVLIGQPWINNVYIAIVVINCTSTLLIQRLTKTFQWSLPKERLACVVVDTVLDAGTAVILPVILVYPYLRSINLEFYSFDMELVYNDVWFIALINENRQIFPLGVMDLAFKFFPQVSLLLSLGSIGTILRRRSEQRVMKQASSRLYEASEGMSRLHKCFVVWGFMLLMCHLVATSMPHPNNRHQMDGCKQQLHPWFVVKSACTVYEFNCYRRGIDTMDEYAGSVDFLDAKSLAVLIVSHCPALRVSPLIQKFYNVLGLEIYNSTLVEWSEQAAITSATHPAITYIFIIRTNLSQIPLALLHGNLPPTLMDIEFSTTNLSTVPPDLHVTWAQVTSLYIEFSQLDTIPDTLLRMNAYDFSVIGNNIKQLPDFAVSADNNVVLALANNPISSLPSSMKNLKSVSIFNLIDTDVASLPDWIDSFGDSSLRVFVTGTPFCKAKSAAEIERDYGFDARISCTYTDGRARARYPLQLTERFFSASPEKSSGG